MTIREIGCRTRHAAAGPSATLRGWNAREKEHR
jgi:hypothetical protein